MHKKAVERVGAAKQDGADDLVAGLGKVRIFRDGSA
jgi:hypothetical protein